MSSKHPSSPATSPSPSPSSCSCSRKSGFLFALFRRLRGGEEAKCSQCSVGNRPAMEVGGDSLMVTEEEQEVREEMRGGASEENFVSPMVSHTLVTSRPHTQVDYVHHLVPYLSQITAAPFYWGKMDRYEAEALLEGREEGSFLLRDSAQEDYLFSVSFRRYGRSLHARIEERGHKFSFDGHDPGVFMSSNIPHLVEHYKDPASCMFFEPMLCQSVNRRNPFSLQFVARAKLCDHLKSYSSVDRLELPKSLKAYLKEYHYRHKVRVRVFDDNESST